MSRASILALDTATDRPSLALGSAERVIAHRHDLSRDIDGAARDLMASCGVAPGVLEGVIVADGPGSFTGLRIGIAFAKGLCRALAIPMFTAPSMMGAGFEATQGTGLVAVDYDALRGQVYRGVFRFDGGAVEVVDVPGLVTAGSPLPAGAIRAGADHATAQALLRLREVSGGVSAVEDPQSWEPGYGRPAEAEARLRARQNASG